MRLNPGHTCYNTLPPSAIRSKGKVAIYLRHNTLLIGSTRFRYNYIYKHNLLSHPDILSDLDTITFINMPIMLLQSLIWKCKFLLIYRKIKVFKIRAHSIYNPSEIRLCDENEFVFLIHQ